MYIYRERERKRERERERESEILQYSQKYMYIYVYIYIYSPGVLGSIPGRVIPKTQIMVLDAALLNTQHFNVWIKGKIE